MDKYLQVKKKHHYIWSHYLKQWAVNKNVFYLTKNGKIASDSVKGLAYEDGFYKIHPLSKQDVDYILACIRVFPSPYLRYLHIRYLSQFVQLSHIYESLNESDESDLRLKKIIEQNSLENLYTNFEGEILKIHQALINGTPSILQNNHSMLKFCIYIGHQMTRTKAFRDRTIGVIRTHFSEDLKTYIDLHNRNYWFISYMLGFNIGIDLFRTRASDVHIFITNNTSVPFITSDSPIINIHKCLKNKAPLEAPTYADFFFPISPKYAYMINQSNDYNSLAKNISEEEVRLLNTRIASRRQQTLFGLTRESIQESLKQK